MLRTPEIHSRSILPSSLQASQQELPRLSGFIPALDGIRGLAVLMILVLHFTRIAPTTPLQNLYATIIDLNWSAVDLFFVLSGFLITGSLLDSKGTPGFLKRFYLRRALRILPLYYATLLVAMANWRFIYPSGNALFKEYLPWYWTYTFNLQIATKGARQCFDTNTLHLWTLSIEEQYYLIWPLIVLWCGRRRLAAVCLAGFFIAFGVRLWMRHAGCSSISIFCFTLCHIDGMALGGLLAILARQPRAYARVRRAVRPMTCGIFAILALIVTVKGRFSADDPVTITLGISLLALLSTCSIAMVIEPGPPAGNLFQRFFNLRLLTTAGKYSYGIYIFHGVYYTPIVHYAERLIGRISPLRWFCSQNAVLYDFTRMLICSMISFWIAYIVWHFFEKHIIRLKRYT